MNPNCPRYVVDYAQDLLERIKTMAKRAVLLGLGAETAAVMRDIIENLESRPAAWGEPGNYFKALGLQAYQRVFVGFRVSYAVDEIRCLVYLQDFEPMPDHVLSDLTERNGRV